MTIAMREIFEKPVDRAIDGVIKADDEASLRIELDEYVITGEIGQRLEQFLDAYNNYKTANGVWISGFFGSGKSHLLKMLALLLENREVDYACWRPSQSRVDPFEVDPVQHRPEGGRNLEERRRRAAIGFPEGVRRDVRLLRQAAAHCAVRTATR
jgi:energy-coupling factor transporter ATP-binding protein EcfA2